MGLPMCLANVSIHMLQKLVVVLLFHVVVANSLYSLQQQQPSCHDEESSALLQFKESFIITKNASGYDASYPKVSSWELVEGESSNCCSWDGVDCDEETGHVIGLDLSSSCLYGSINSSSSLFRLVHLQSLNLADNNFNYSQIPTSIRYFPRLTHLDLSYSVFAGQVPSEISHLSKLLSLDLSLNLNTSSGQKFLTLDASSMRSLVQNLTSLEMLSLSYVNISSTVPNSMANLSFLTSLLLKDCGIFGEFPARIFKLQNLKTLSVGFNQDLTGYVPGFNQSSPLMVLKLADTSFSGNLPSSIEKLDSLNELDVGGCNFSGIVPYSLGNLRHLTYLRLSYNNFDGPIPTSLANLTQLTYLSLSENNFSGSRHLSWVGKHTKLTALYLNSINLSGYIPSSLINLTQLTSVELDSNQLTGPIPSWLGNLTKLVDISVADNKLHGSLPESIYTFVNLQSLYLDGNSMSGIVQFDKFLKLQNLTHISLSFNKLEVVSESRIMNGNIAQFQILELELCSIREFPYFLRYQERLELLRLRRNKLHGLVPKWMWNTSTETLQFLDLSENFLSGFDQPPAVLHWVSLEVLNFSSNMLQGPLPVPPPNIKAYQVSYNKLSGEISPLMCNLSSLLFLDLSNNKLSGMIPQCLGNFSDNLVVLRLRNNSFEGILPQTYSNRSNLRVIDVSHNRLQGPFPRSMENCLMLEFLVLSNNEFNVVFPIWLADLPELKLLIMRHNRFYGLIGKPESKHGFPKLVILDLSYNDFRGEFLIDYIFSENAMMRTDLAVNQSTYMKADLPASFGPTEIAFPTTITIKGLELNYPKIQEAFAVIDISSNKFEGKIHEFIGNLKGLRSLNVSINNLTGGIPSFLASLTLLESLDLSQNKLSGEIPQQLMQLTFLAKFNVSHNYLTGRIPQGTQLTSFDITAYEGNPGLCEDPLPKCVPPPPSTIEGNDSGSGIIEFDWIFVLAGVGSGFLVGVVLSDVVITRRRELFIEIVGRIRQMKRWGSRRSRNYVH